jgi:cytoskeletal protein RodZ
MAEIGSTLREARMRAHIDITEVEARTKIRAKYLRALENEEWDLLPGPVYVKSFVKTYGDFLGLDSRLLVDEFKRRYERPMEYEGRASTSPPTTARERDRRQQKRPSRLSGFFFSPRSVIVIALAVIVVALYLIGSHGSGNSGTNTPVTNTVAENHGTKPGKKTGTTTTPGSHTGTSTPDTTTTPPPPPAKATFALVATGTVWVCVENQTGRVLAPAKDYLAGEKITTRTGKTLLVGLGNSDADLTVNGKPYTPTGSSAIGLKITPKGGAHPLTPGPTCTG